MARSFIELGFCLFAFVRVWAFGLLFKYVLMQEVLFMGYRSQTGSRRSAGQKFQKSQHEKAKAKA